jgi:sec-independent protein translocase protein TatC
MASDADEHRMPLLEHLAELRTRLIYAAVAFLVVFIGSYYFSGDIFGFLVAPLARQFADLPNHRMIYTALHEAFFTQVKVAFFTAAFISFPIISAQIWMFVAPGLYKHERKAFLPFLIATPILFLVGAAFVYYLVIPMAWSFFLGFQTTGGEGELAIQLEPKVNEYLSLSMRLIFAFGVGFELPVLLTLLGRIGIVSSKGLAKQRRYAIVAAFVAAAILTPPDVVSQLGLAVPIMLLYEISIWLVRIIERKRGDDAKEAEEAEADGPPDDDDDDSDGLGDDTDFNMNR